ncbi:GNAT family N-acetyltransferase [Vibrio gallicus]|uniref:GNAT family N-acetyltransferase n=1 Tax=Vibrio gallicus TaxID=190897 RepID=UPI0021C4A52D|nr:GNAT family N-acetyltransferase [Vibrio gallicus]
MLYTIAKARLSDAAAINLLSSHLGYTPLSSQDAIKKLSALLASPTDEIYVAKIEQKIVGWLHLFYARRLASPDFYEIGGLVVTPQYRKQGIGRALVEHALKSHPEKCRVRCNTLRVETHQLYEGIDFKDSKLQRVFERHA